MDRLATCSAGVADTQCLNTIKFYFSRVQRSGGIFPEPGLEGRRINVGFLCDDHMAFSKFLKSLPEREKAEGPGSWVLAEGHKVTKWETGDMKSCLTPKPTFFSTVLPLLMQTSAMLHRSENAM